ncbi:TetR/AcrR family transcriptional regulator [Micromonospora sp. NBC_01796]|uniref:TetR/AcrR family transcriptional regulator n=1 Tax=Micromonospora sp. NBC_01796 TaxID=2975987 RepID=UPI002DD80EF2|nr:TetR/AcrR family transcriptional regulator [Micromonospora sp. NBC_01796]WSA88409.1 TetR/AcrR family transcriptional regulator [Micromonospora sp. NBC_01796]
MATMGRPREFDVDEVLESALRVFWAKGYEGATMADLASATGLKPGSIYAAFGCKIGLFMQVVDRYVRTVVTYGPAAIEADSAREVVRIWLDGVVRATSGADTPPGCLLVQAALVSGEGADKVRAELRDRRQAAEVALTERFERARRTGDLPVDAEPEVAARYVVALAQGIAVQAASGASRADLQRMADLALVRLPWE